MNWNLETWKQIFLLALIGAVGVLVIYHVLRPKVKTKTSQRRASETKKSMVAEQVEEAMRDLGKHNRRPPR